MSRVAFAEKAGLLAATVFASDKAIARLQRWALIGCAMLMGANFALMLFAPLGIALVALWGGLYALYAPPSLTWYIVGCAISGFYWSFALPLMLGILARIDRTGRGAVLGGTMSSVGGTLGPLLVGLLVHGSNYQPVGWLVAMLCAAGLICVMLVENRSPSMAVVGQGS